MDFIKHVFSYFQQGKAEHESGESVANEKRRSKATKELVPVYKNGRLVRYIEPESDEEEEEEKQSVTKHPPPKTTNPKSQLHDPQKRHSMNQGGDLYRLRPDGMLEKVEPNRSSVLPPVSVPLPRPASSRQPEEKESVQDGTSNSSWDGWPDGVFSLDLTWEQYEETGKLLMHWATKGNGGYRKSGTDFAPSWEEGKKNRRKCLGIIRCNNPSCAVIVRPHTNTTGIHAQLRKSCRCGAPLTYEPCDISSYTWSWMGGVHFQHTGFHTHVRPTHILHLIPDQQRAFDELVTNHPKSGPLQLVVGVPTLHGPGKSVGEISTVLLNKDRVAKERQKIVRGKTVTAEGLFDAIQKFSTKCKNFVIGSVFAEETVISVQSPFMRSQLVKNARLEGSVNGTVNDAAHGWWKNRKSLLLVSSTYCPTLKGWVPGMLSYSNGASERHFMHHFSALMQSIAFEAESRGLPVDDSLFLGMMDFSQAERGGFIRAFIEFWMARSDNTRTRQELQVAAEHLLKGCREHFRANVTRISRISGIIPPEKAEEFVRRALSLLDAPDSREFVQQAELLVRDFPLIRPWMGWWMRPSIASMLFESERKMDIDVWESMPADNNAEESMHWRLYQACGRDHELIEGLYALARVADHFKQQYEHAQDGGLTGYGQAEGWKARAEKFGTTKQSRKKGQGRPKKNDGRPPDTIKELLLKPRPNASGPNVPVPNAPVKSTSLKQETKEPPKTSEPKKLKKVTFDPKADSAKKNEAKPASLPKPKVKKSKKLETDLVDSGEQLPPCLPSYPWRNNSCWLDTSLEILYQVYLRFPEDFTTIRTGLPSSSPLQAVLGSFVRRQDLNGQDATITRLLSKERDEVRRLLRQRKIIQTLSGFESLYVWFTEMIRLVDEKTSHRSRAAFEVLLLDIHKCSGSSEIGGPHIEIQHSPRRSRIQQLNEVDHEQYQGSFGAFLQDFVALDRLPRRGRSCWRVKDGVPMCPGEREDIRSIVLSLPLLLTFEVGDAAQHTWDFPPSISLLAEDDGLTYELVGLGLTNLEGNHFTARYLSGDHSVIYTYDDMKNKGLVIAEPGATIETHMAGRQPLLPTGFVIYQVFYVLRGGLSAQEAFFRRRSPKVEAKYGLQISSFGLHDSPSITMLSDKFVELRPSDRTWLFNPFTKSTLEYVSASHSDISTTGDHDDVSDSLGPESEEDLHAVTQDADKDSNASSESDTPNLPTHVPVAQTCRCGILARGSDINKYGETIQCTKCKGWSHSACHTDGRVFNRPKHVKFVCDICIRDGLFFMINPPDPRSPEMLKKLSRKRLINRLQIGSGALVQLGDFWYPARIIRKVEAGWIVKWWRGNKFLDATISHEQPYLAKVPSIIDALWNQMKERRKIRLGRWLRSIDVELLDPDDVLLDPVSTPYTEDVERALAPHTDVLKSLLFPEVETPSDAVIPARDWLQNTPRQVGLGLVPYSGSLSIAERAQVANWFYIHIAQKDRARWANSVGLLPLAHAVTLFIAHKLKSKPDFKELAFQDLIQRAWESQYSDLPPREGRADVDLEALEVLERQLFEVSEAGGDASYYQWGLDVGHHQEDWYPYNSRWNRGDFKTNADESELLEEGPDYILYVEPERPVEEEPEPPKPKPKPRPLKKKTQVVVEDISPNPNVCTE